MRVSILLLAALAATALAARHHDALNYYENFPLTENHVRAKRNAGGHCDSGWTGQYCENPVCTTKNSDIAPPSNTGYAKMIDSLFLPSGCMGQYYVPFDSMSSAMQIMVTTSAGQPNLTLYNAAGIPVPATNSILQATTGFSRFQGLAPGDYTFTINNDHVSTTFCSVVIEAFTNVTTDHGFTYSAQSDYPVYGESAEEGTGMNIIAHAFNLPAPAKLGAVTVRSDRATTPVWRSLLTPRYGCSYESFAAQFTCTGSATDYTITFDGTDANGYSFRRTETFACVKPITTPHPPTPTTPVMSACLNGGTILYPGTPQAFCFCPPRFSGANCAQPTCMNGGSLAPGGVECLCKDGYEGTNCQNIICQQNAGSFLTDDKSLVVVVRNTVSMNPYIAGIVKAVERQMQSHSIRSENVYKDFILVTFANGDYQAQTYLYSQYNAFLGALKALNTSTIVGGCNDTVLAAVSSIFPQYPYNKSPVFVFTDAAPSDYDNWRSIAEANGLRKFPFYFYYFEDGCKVDTLSTGFQVLQYLAEMTGGLAVTGLAADDFSLTFQLNMAASTYHMNQIAMDDLKKCNVAPWRTFFVDSSMKSVVIMATGSNLNINIQDPKWHTDSLMLLYNRGNMWFYEVSDLTVGEYLFSVSSSNAESACSFRIVGYGDYDMFFATTPELFIDATYAEPIVGKARHLAVQLNGLRNHNIPDFERLTAELVITTNDPMTGAVHKPVYMSNGQWRDGCGFHLYFGAANFCQYPDQMFYATVYADDGSGYTIMRTTTGYCSGTETTVSPPGTCQNGGVPNPMNNGTCICTPNYQGQYCTQIICQNGGDGSKGFCQCPVGMSGTFCELYACTQTQAPVDMSFIRKSLSFVISVTPSMNSTLQALSNGVSDMVRDIQAANLRWIEEWSVVAVSNSYVYPIVQSNKPSDFILGVQHIAAHPQDFMNASNPSPQTMIESGMNAAVKMSRPNSYVYLFTDSDAMREPIYLSLLSEAETKQVGLNFFGVSNNLAGNPNGTFAGFVEEMALLTGGSTLQTTNVAELLNYIVSFYESGVSQDAYYADCTQPQTLYVPVDGTTQAFTIAVTGDTPKLMVTLPDGTPALNSMYDSPMIADSKFALNQYIAKCDSVKWDSRKSYCYLLESNKKSWLEGSQYCHFGGAYLADVYSADKQAFMNYETGQYDYWLGLIRRGNTDDWVWDGPTGSALAPLQGYTNWGTDDRMNLTQNCVVVRGGKWYPADCNEPYLYVCQKHKYGQGIYEGDFDTNLVPPGFYKVQVQTASGSCILQARAQSKIQVFYGFSQDPHSDFPSRYANSDANNNVIVATPVGLLPFHMDTKPSAEGHLNYAMMGYKGEALNPVSFSDRRYCSYNSVSTPFSCIEKGQYLSSFFVKFTGIDQYGFSFQRFSNALCTKNVVTCKNGGYTYNGQCVCPMGFTGNRCETPQCANGGVENKAGTGCICPTGWSGNFCEEAMCEPPYPATFVDSNRTLAIVLETSWGMSATIFQIRKNLIATLQMVMTGQTAGWFSNFVLIPFDSASNQASWYPITASSNYTDLVNALAAIKLNACPGAGPCSNFCPRPIMSTLKTALSHPSLATPNSVVLVVTRSSAEDYELAHELTHLIEATKAQINFVLPASTSPCGAGWNTPEAEAIYQVISYSAGSIFMPTPLETATTFMTQYVPTLYRSAGIELGMGQNCSQQTTVFQIDSKAYDFTIDYYGANAQLSLVGPDGEDIQLPKSVITSLQNYIGVISVNDTGVAQPGTYTLSSTSTGNYCYLNIRTRSDIELYVGYTQVNDAYSGATQDDAHYYPVAGGENVILVHGDGLTDQGYITYAQIINPRRGLEFVSEMRRRDKGCSYEYYSTKTFDCMFEEFVVIVYGVDGHGMQFHRNYPARCVDNRPRPPPPPPHCSLTAHKADTVFLIDSSLEAGLDNFNAFEDFIVNVMKPYTIGPDAAQVGALTVSSKPISQFSFLSADNMSVVFDSRVHNMYRDGASGQNISTAMQMIERLFTTPAQGYRIDRNVRHNIIYLTASPNGPTDSDPVNWVRAMRRSGLYGFATVALGMPQNGVLDAMNGDRCLYYAKNAADLNTYGVNFVQGLACERFPRCGM